MLGDHQEGAGPTCAEGPLRLCDFLDTCRHTILAQWELLLRRTPEAQPLSEPALRDHIPQLLDRIAEVVRSLHTGVQASLENLPALHALQRLDIGFDLRTVVQELAALRKTILQLYRPHAEGRSAVSVTEEVERLNEAIDEVIEKSVAAYAKARERTLVALDRISASALGTGDLKTFLPKLLAVLLETTEAADLATVLLKQGGRLILTTSVGALANEEDGFSLAFNEGFAGKVVTERRPVLLRLASEDPLVLNPAIKEAGTKALYGVPLIHEGEVIGVAKMGSRSAHDFSDDDKQLFRVMAQRATSLIVQAQLVDKLRESELRFRSFVDANVVGVIFWDMDGDIGDANDAFLEMLGFSRDDLNQGRVNWRKLTPPEYTESDAAHVQRLVTTGSHPPYEKEYVHKDGHRVPVLVTSATYAEDRRHGLAYVLDLTERKRAEQRAQEAVMTAEAERRRLDALLEALRESELRFRTLADNIAQLAWITDAKGAVSWYNKRWHDYTGTTPEEVQGWGWQRVHHPEHVQRVVEKIRHHLETGEPWEDTFPLRGKDGTYRWFLSRAIPIRGPDGNIIRWFGTNTDVTEALQATEELRQTAIFREQFIGVLGHDLRNPLAALKTSIALLLRQENLKTQQLRTLQRMAGTADRMERMIADLLDFARGRLGGGIPLNRGRVDLAEVAHRSVEEVQFAYPDHEIEFTAATPALCECDADRLSQVIGNLLTNAIVHGREDTPVQVEVSRAQPEVKVKVKNLGTPIPDKLRSNLFEPFSRAPADPSRGRSLGLGLFIVKQIVDAHHGRITVESTADTGTTFTVYLPTGAHAEP